MFINLIRYLDFAMFGVGCAFMFITNVLAFRVLRPPKKLGFLWWHVTSISIAFVCLGSVAVQTAFSRLGEETSWRAPVTFVGLLLFMVAQIIIFSVERQRYAAQVVSKVANVEIPNG